MIVDRLSKKTRVVALVGAMSVAVGTAVPAFAQTSVPSTPEPVLAEYGEVLDEQAQAEIHGENFLAGFVIGGWTGAASYVVTYAWNNYVAHDPMPWSWSDFGRSTLIGGVTGGLGSALGVIWR